MASGQPMVRVLSAVALEAGQPAEVVGCGGGRAKIYGRTYRVCRFGYRVAFWVVQ